MKFGRLSLQSSSPESWIAVRGPVLVVNYRAGITPDAMQRTERIQKQVLDANGGKCLMLSVVEGGLPMPSDDGRAGLSAHFKRVSSANVAFATAIAGSGFWVSAARALLSTLQLVVKPACPAITTGSLEEAARFLAEHGGALAVDVPGLVADVEAMRALAAREPVVELEPT